MTVKQEKRGLITKLGSLEAQLPIEYIIRFTLAFLLARARIFSGFAPFGVAFAAAAPAGAVGFLTAAGTCLGAFTGGVYWGFKYASSALVIRVVLQLFCDTDAGRRSFFAPLVTFFTMLCIGAVYAFDTGWAMAPTVLYLAETFLAAGCVLFYHVALSPWQNVESGTYGRTCHYISTLLLLATVCMSLSSPLIFSVLSLGRCAAVFVIMFVVYRGGAGMGCVCAVAMGAAMDLAWGVAPFFTMCYALATLTSSIFSKNGRLPFLLTFTAGSSVAVLWTWTQTPMLPALYETFAASVLFLLMPEGLLARAGTLLPSSGTGYGFLKAREYTRDRVELTASAFKGLYDTVRTAAGDDSSDNISIIFDRASEQVCRDCSSCGHCWTQNYSDTVDVLNNITPRLLKNGSVTNGDFPQRFSSCCVHFKEFIAAINSETRTFLCRKQYRARLAQNRGAAFSQFNDISTVLESLSQELGSEITVEPSLERRLQRYLRGLQLDAATAVFRVRGGRLRVELRGNCLRNLIRDEDYLNKLSSLLGVRLCTSQDRMDGDKLILLEAEPLAVTIGAASRRKNGEPVNGDKGIYFRTDEGFLCVLLSDGMGSGEEAARLSASTAMTLERFLKAGVAPEIALRILQDLMLLRSDTDIGSATVDLLYLNMFSGEAKIYKYGAAPSYLRKGNAVRRLASGSLPLGIDVSGSRPCGVTLKLLPGSCAVLLSDGVLAGGDDRWLKQLVASFDESQEPRALARAILDAAIEHTGGEDDMTVLAVQTTERD